MTNWKKVKLDDIAIIHNSRRVPLNSREREISKGKFPYYGASGIVDYVDSYLFEGEHVLISEDGENLRSRQTPIAFKANGKFWVNNHAHIVKGKLDYLNDWIVYFFSLLDLSPYISGAVQPKLNKENLLSIPIDLPESDNEIKSIVNILKSLDDKIELNRQMNHTLEQMAQALFKKYFVNDIDPENLPEGWRYATYGEFIDSVSVTHKFKKSKIVFLNTGDIYNGNVLHQNYSEVDSLPGQAKKSIKRNDILFTEIRPANKRFAFINFDADDFVVSTKLMVLRAKAEIDSLFFYFLLTREETLTDLQNKAEARSGTFPQITFDQVHELKFILPNNGLIERFDKEVLRPNYELIFKNEKEIATLIEMRDSLLPKLMSGEIETKEAETILA